MGELPRLTTYIAQHDASDAGYRWALDRLLDRGWGKPTQPISGTDGQPIRVTLDLGDSHDGN